MSIELKQAAQDAVEALDWLLKTIRRDAPQLSGKAMGNAEKCACALRIALRAALTQQAEDQRPATPELAVPFVATYWSESIGGKQHDTGRVNKGPRGGFFASTASIEDASLIADALNAYTYHAPIVPEGYALVPIEPTAEMLQAALKVATPGALRAAWARMLAASPEQKS